MKPIELFFWCALFATGAILWTARDAIAGVIV